MLAPLAGISDWPFRLMCFEMGADACVTEMVSAQGYLSAPPSRRAYRDILEVHPDEGPVTAQLFGHDPRTLALAAQRLSDEGRYAGIDLNMGCPAPKVCSGGSGCALMRTPALARDIMRACRKATALPLSAKLRLGWDAEHLNAALYARMAQDEGLESLTLHGRTRAQQYAGRADWDQIALVRQAVRIPVYANGDVFSAEDALRIIRHTGCAGAAIGRGALGNPWIFRQIRQALAGHTPEPPTHEEVLDLSLRHARMLCAWKGERHAVVEMRKHFAWYLKGMRGAAEQRARINRMERLEEVELSLRAFFAGPAN